MCQAISNFLNNENGITYAVFGLYLLMMISIGLYCFFKTKDVKDYLLGGRNVSSWVTALSAEASDMSGWLLMGVPGVVYMFGPHQTWVVIGLGIGTYLNWKMVGPRLRVYTEKTESLTLASFFCRRFRDPSGCLQIFSAIVTLIFFTIYAASGLVGAGKLFESLFGIDYQLAVIIGCLVLLFYTVLGGYLAVCWTDLIQGALMFFALIIVPAVAFFNIDFQVSSASTFNITQAFSEAYNAIGDVCQQKNISLSFLPPVADGVPAVMAIVAIISMAVWGLGYFGQPHILVRFMSIKSAKQFPSATRIAMTWVSISMIAAVLIGFVAIPIYYGKVTDAQEAEKVFIYMVRDFCNPWIGGVLLSAILAAIMSTIDSQLLAAGSTLTADFYKLIRKKSTTREEMHISRVFVLIICILACIMALNPSKTIFALVTFAWGGFGAAFGPVVLMSLYSKRTSWQSALCGMVAGTAVMLVWYFLGWGSFMYEILPGFAAGLLAINIANIFWPQKDSEVLAEFDQVKAEMVK
jgi:sodium/proline symporter